MSDNSVVERLRSLAFQVMRGAVVFAAMLLGLSILTAIVRFLSAVLP
jgi:hypothetical protein